MGRIKNDNLYIFDSPASKFDKVIGSDAENSGRTKNYLLGELFALFNTLGGGGVFSYTYTSDLADLDIIEGLVATNDSETDPDGVNLLRFSRTDLFGNDLRTLVENYNNNSDGVVLKITSEADPNLICAYTITGINADTNWVEISVLRHKNLNTLTFEVAKNFTLTFDLVNLNGFGGGGGATNTSQLVNDGEDGINPFISLQDLITDHTALSNIGLNTHVQIDSHIADSTIHFTQASISITESQISDLQAYLLSETDPVFSAWLATPPNVSIFTNDAGYLTSFTETDPIFLASPAGSITNTDIINWDTAFGWGDHALAGYLTSETDSQTLSWNDTTNTLSISGGNSQIINNFTGLTVNTDEATFNGDTRIGSALFLTLFSPISGRNLISVGQNGGQAYSITDNSSNWNTAFGWGDHSLAGYLTALPSISIKDLSDVFSSMTPSDGQVLTYDSINGWQAETTPSGVTDHTLLSNIGTNTHAQIDTAIGGYLSHAADTSIHFTEASINHANILNVGTNSHAQIDTAIGAFLSHETDLSIHFTENPNWNTAFGWGDHSLAGYLTTESDTLDSVTTRGNSTVNGITVGSLQLSGGAGSQGLFTWNTDEETVDIIQNGATLQVGQETQYHARNNTGITIPDGTAVMATGTLGASSRITIAPMVNDGTINPEYFIGITTEEIPNGEDGKVTNFGKIRGLNTTGIPVSETWIDGDLLYLDATVAGTLTKVEPPAIGGTTYKSPVAIVIHSHASTGTILVRVLGNQGIHELHDVQLTAIANEDVIRWNTTNSRFENYSSTNWDTAFNWGDHAGLYSLVAHNHTLDSLSNVTITTNSIGELLKWNGTAWVNNTLAEAGISAVGHTHTFASLTSIPTTIAGYGITDAYTKVEADGKYLLNTGDTFTGNLVVTGSVKAGNFVVTGGLATEFLKANGTLDSNTYLTSFDITTQTDPKYLRSDVADTKTAGNLRMATGVPLYFGDTIQGLLQTNGASELMMNLLNSDFKIRDNNATRFTFGRTTGDFTATGTITSQGTGNNSFLGNVGIGTPTPESRLHLYELGVDSPTTLILENGDTTINSADDAHKIEFQSNDASANGVGVAASIRVNAENAGNLYALAFNTQNGADRGERMRITGTGNVGIGNTTPAYELDVTGDIHATATVITGVYTVATLPTGVQGARAMVTDSNSTTFNATVAGGGANIVPVFYNGTNWKIG